MSIANDDPSTWDMALDAVVAAPQNHKVLFENENLRVLEVILHSGEEEPVHHHRWPSVFVLDQIQGPVHDISPDGEQLPPNRDVIQALEAWDGKGCLVVNMAPQAAGRVHNASGKTIHGVRIEMKI
ncbi:hypothetical protein [Rhizobium sp. Root1220]|uniref:hypothetical protein n=1 Tax=Rhizobium sp. Root1220 TaxID=1736432 RepID=UPI0006F7E361|nr:hypothetical protein [Rhizobium sp. Root1220]KQV66042.1 hypothetical protein ASC90_12570 [Rhizobium sp. Root1220]